MRLDAVAAKMSRVFLLFLSFFYFFIFSFRCRRLTGSASFALFSLDFPEGEIGPMVFSDWALIGQLPLGRQPHASDKRERPLPWSIDCRQARPRWSNHYAFFVNGSPKCWLDFK